MNVLLKFTSIEFEHNDNRGSLKQLVSSGWSQVNVIHSLKGSIRGNHYHRENSELFYLISGSFKINLQKDKVIEEYVIKPGEMFIIKPGITHSFMFLEDTVLISMYDKGVESTAEFDIFNS